MILHQLFCDTDDFCQDYLPDWKRTQLQTGDKKRCNGLIKQDTSEGRFIMSEEVEE